MSTFLLIHSGWQGGSCWDKVKAVLESAGHKVLAPDLPAHGDDKTPVEDVTLELYSRATVEFASAASEKVILVGHSMSGMSNSQATELAPELFRAVVYLSAFLPSDGQCLFDLAAPDEDNMIQPNIIFSDDGLTMTVNPSAIREAVYADCSDEDIATSRARTRPEPSAPFSTPVQLTDERSGTVPKYFIECLQDRAISPKFQKKMYTDNPCVKVFSIDSSHSPYLSQPEEVARHLMSI